MAKPSLFVVLLFCYDSENFLLGKVIGWSKSPALGCTRIAQSAMDDAFTCT
jgi:hypothetical protein